MELKPYGFSSIIMVQSDVDKFDTVCYSVYMNVFEAKVQLNKFLDAHPHLKPQQAKIDSMLRGAGNSHNRMLLLRQLIDKELLELKKQCDLFVTITGK